MGNRLAVVRIIFYVTADFLRRQDKNFIEADFFLEQMANGGLVGYLNFFTVKGRALNNNFVVALNGFGVAQEQEQNIFRHKIFSLRARLATLRAEFAFINGTTLASPFIADGSGLAALRTELAFINGTALAFPFVDNGFWRTALRTEIAAIFFMTASRTFPRRRLLLLSLLSRLLLLLSHCE